MKLPDEFAEWSPDQLFRLDLYEMSYKDFNFTKLSGFHRCNKEDIKQFGQGRIDGFGYGGRDKFSS